jgi:hypothetical protein
MNTHQKIIRINEDLIQAEKLREYFSQQHAHASFKVTEERIEKIKAERQRLWRELWRQIAEQKPEAE